MRTLTRLGAATLLASGGLAAIGAPAHAADTATDLELSVVGTKLAAGAEGKLGWAKITNKGPNTPRDLAITADLSELDLETVVALPATPDCEPGTDPNSFTITCPVPRDELPGPGETVNVPIVVLKLEGASTGYSAPVTFSLSSADDTTPANNSKKAQITLSDESGVDLGVDAPDVKTKIVGEIEEGPLRPGDTTQVHGFVFNWGDVAARGLRVTVQLPEHVTFAEAYDGCEYDADNRKATCTDERVVLRPASDESGEFGLGWSWEVKVADDLKAPITLPDGSMTVEALGVEQLGMKGLAVAPLPDFVKPVSAKDANVTEVDASDNVDAFAVVLPGDAAPSPAPSPTPGGGGSGDGGSSDGDAGSGDGSGGAGGGEGLPVTGVQAGLIGGVGVAALAGGGLLFMLARRRRVVLVAPGDEKASA